MLAPLLPTPDLPRKNKNNSEVFPLKCDLTALQTWEHLCLAALPKQALHQQHAATGSILDMFRKPGK